MKKISSLMLTLVLFLTPAFVGAADKATPGEAVNKICPVSGEKAGGMGPAYKLEHNGKVYALCCEMCRAEFERDPDKYSKIAESEKGEGS